MTRVILGVDTSCYTTSIAAVSLEGQVLSSERRLLSVPLGGRGLRQSEGVFQHVKALPALMEALRAKIGEGRILAVCASTRPREAQGSYMPVFTVGEGAGRQMAAALRVPFYPTDHQSGHVAAARIGAGLDAGAYLALHLSGGTTEVLLCEGGRHALLGGSQDLHAGQFVDRIGVKLGLPFPAGPELEKLAEGTAAASRIGAFCKGLSCSFSGPEAQAARLIASGELTAAQVAAEVYSCLARTVEKLLVNASAQTGLRRVLLAGGVVSSQRFRKELLERAAAQRSQLELTFAKPEYSGDNAAGVALLGLARYRKDGGKLWLH